MSILEKLREYDREREAYIFNLEEENKALKAKLRKVEDELLKGTHANASNVLEAVLAGINVAQRDQGK